MKVLPTAPLKAANIHAGLDETSAVLRVLWPEMKLSVWDIYNAPAMSEPSIARARRRQRGAWVAPAVDFKNLPETYAALDTVFLIFAGHEIRSAGHRDLFFGELSRILKPGSQLLVVEHLRDWKNFLAYGLGFLHFLPRGEWIRLGDSVGFRKAGEFSITPFVRVFLYMKD